MADLRLNRPLASYLIVQSSLVLILLAAAHLSFPMVEQATGFGLTRLQWSLALVLFTQMPVAVMFASSERRNLTSGEGWLMGGTFVGFTVLAESGLQAAIARLWPLLARQHGLGPQAAQEAMVFGICLTLLGFLIASFLISALFRLAVRNNLNCDSAEQKQVQRSRTSPARRLQTALALGLASLAGAGLAWGMETGIAPLTVLAVVVVVIAVAFGSWERLSAQSQPVRHHFWWDLIPFGLTGVMTWATAGVCIRLVKEGAGGRQVLNAVWPGLAEVSTTTLTTIATQISGILLGLVCANIVVIWLYGTLIRPMLTRHTPAPTTQSGAGRGPIADMPGFPATEIPREEALEMIRAARELLLEHQPLTRRRRPRHAEI